MEVDMFQIFDCNNKPVGRSEGYKKHSTAQSLVNKPYSIRHAIYRAFYSKEQSVDRPNLVYSIRWVDKA
jgi:hypothetical protein